MKLSFTLFYSLSAVVLFTAGCTSSVSQKSSYTLEELQTQKWALTQINDQKVTQEEGSTVPYLIIDKKMMAVGATGCNQFFAEANIEKSKLRLEHMNTTRKVCEKNVVALENDFNDKIQQWNAINIDGNTLRLSNDKSSLTFTATN